VNRQGTRIHHFAVARALILTLGLGVGISFVSGEARASKDDKLSEQAWACSTLFSRYPIRVSNGEDDETALCLGEGKKGRKPMSRSEAFELCREQFNATSLLIDWTSKGWHCRYYGR
jgi:hypothetical protein